MNELISIIINVFNGEKYIKKCLDSVINQTYKNIEIIIVNDGSTDDTLNIIKKYDDERIIIVNQKNKGLSLSRNVGIEKATGDYLYFVDSDDYIENDTIEYLYKLIKDNDGDFSTCNPLDIYDYDFKVNNKKEEINILSREDMLKKVLISSNRCGTIWNKLFKKELFKEIRFPNRIVNDVLVLYKIVLISNKIIYSNQIKYYYLRHRSSILGRHKIEHSIDFYNAVIERYNYIDKIYPDMIHNKISILICIVTLYGHNDSKVDKYLEEEKAFELYNELFCLKVLFIDLDKKEKYKLLLFRISKKLYRKLLKKHLKLKK